MEKKQLDTILLNESDRFSTYLETYENGHKAILKVINPECLEDISKYEKILRQFNQEKQILREMKIEGIPQYMEGGKNYLKLSYIRGKTLKELVKERKLSTREKIYIMSSIFFILKNVHDNNIIHCDIKPSNIICGIDKKIYLIDFGSATKRGEKSIYIQGSGGFSAPEIYKSRDKKDYGVDIFSLMAVGYWLKYGKKYDIESDSSHMGDFFLRWLSANSKKRFKNLNEILEIIKERKL